MNMTRHDWTRDDDELAEEFADVSQALNERKPVPPVPSALNRRIAEMAGTDPIAQLESNWLFGQQPRLFLAIVLFFAIAAAFFLA